MKAGLIAVIIAGLVAIAVPAVNALQYTVHQTKVTAIGAWQQCIENGGTLAYIETPRQNTMVLAAIKKSGVTENCWLSGSDLGLEGSWIWLSRSTKVGSPFGFVNFANGEPSNAAGENCMTIDNAGTWNDEPCTNTHCYVCEYYSV